MKKEYGTNMRIGRKIRDFIKGYLNDRIELIKTVSHKRGCENVQMPSESIRELSKYRVKRYYELVKKSVLIAVCKEIAKILGK